MPRLKYALPTLLAVCAIVAVSSTGVVGGAGLVSNSSHATPALNPSGSDVPVNLLGEMYVSTSLVYNGFLNTGNRSFPVLLTGSETSAFWSSSQSVLELAPSSPAAHSSGMVMFSSAATTETTLRIVGAAGSSANYSSGDGLEAYFFMTPTHAANWSTPYYATQPEGANGTFISPQGSVLFPYSFTPYIAVQWDPAFGHLHAVNLYLVTPALQGLVSPATISAMSVGTGAGPTPASTDYVALTLRYDAAGDELVGNVTDETTGAVLCSIDASLNAYGFAPDYSPTSQYYFGAGGSGNSANSWGVLYLGLSHQYPPLAFTTISPSSVRLAAGVAVNLSADALTINGTAIATGVTFAWSFFPPSLGSLNATRGPEVTFTAGNVSQNGTVFENATYHGVTIEGFASVSATGGPAPSSSPSLLPLFYLVLLIVFILAVTVAVVLLSERRRGKRS